jgi:hypothetical protein
LAIIESTSRRDVRAGIVERYVSYLSDYRISSNRAQPVTLALGPTVRVGFRILYDLFWSLDA